MRSDRFDHYAKLFDVGDDAVLPGVRTGLPALDHLLTTLAPGHLTVLAGRPSMRKTALALDIARNVATNQEKTVAILSLEMTKEQLFDRLFGSAAGIAPWMLAKGRFTDEQFQDMGPAMDELGKQRIFIDDDPNRTLTNLRSKAHRLQLEEGIDLLIIDYLQLIQVTDRHARENRTREMSYVSEHIKQLARELQCPVLALSQLSRDCERRPDKRPQLSDLRDSGSIEQDADHVLMLFREGYYEPDANDPDLTDVYLRKNRHGPVGQVELRFEKERMTFASVEKTRQTARSQATFA